MAKLVGFINKIYNYVAIAISYIRPMQERRFMHCFPHARFLLKKTWIYAFIVDSCTVFLTPDSYSRIIWIYAFIIDPCNPSYIDSYLHARGVYFTIKC